MEHKISNGVPENVLPSEDTPLLSGSDDGNGNHHNGVTPSSQGSGVSSSDRNSTASESSDSDEDSYKPTPAANVKQPRLDPYILARMVMRLVLGNPDNLEKNPCMQSFSK